jgi:pyruvate,water dikinase
MKQEAGTEKELRYVVWLGPHEEWPASLIGNKALGVIKLMKLMHLGFKVPEGFVVTTEVYNEIFNQQATEEIRKKIKELSKRSEKMQEFFLQHRLPPYDLGDFIFSQVAPAYKKLCDLYGENIGVAVRSSAVYEDLETKSYAGSYESYLNVRGTTSLVKYILRCFASAWQKHLLKDREKNKIPKNASIALLVQRMIDSDVAGVTFTADPVSGDTTQICINSAWGLGDAIVSGRVNADIFCYDKRTMQLKQQRVGEKNVRSLCLSAGGTHLEPVPPEMIYIPSLTHENAIRLALICYHVEKELGFPVDIEWAYSKNDLYLLQVRPITTL